MGAADAQGRVVSYIQSIYWEFGSGVVLAELSKARQTQVRTQLPALTHRVF